MPKTPRDIIDGGDFDEQKAVRVEAQAHEKALAEVRKGLERDLRVLGLARDQAAKVAQLHDGDALPDLAYAAAKYLVTGILSGDTVIPARDLSSTLNSLVSVARLELGKKDPSLTITAEERKAMIREWREEIQRKGAKGLEVVEGGNTG